MRPGRADVKQRAAFFRRALNGGGAGFFCCFLNFSLQRPGSAQIAPHSVPAPPFFFPRKPPCRLFSHFMRLSYWELWGLQAMPCKNDSYKLPLDSFACPQYNKIQACNERYDFFTGLE
jgi:hypothetical protein